MKMIKQSEKVYDFASLPVVDGQHCRRVIEISRRIDRNLRESRRRACLYMNGRNQQRRREEQHETTE